MVISKKATEDFLNRSLDEWDFWKDTDEKILDAEISSLNPQPKPHTKWKKHQKDCFLIGVDNPSFNFFLKPGMGKTLIALELFRWRKQQDPLLTSLVLVPGLSNLYGWKKQIEEHAPELNYCILEGTKQLRQKKLRDNPDGDVYVINYLGMISLCSELKSQKGKKNKKREIDEEMVENFMEDIDFAVFDESHVLKNHRSQTFSICKLISENVKYVYGLTGTPASRSAEDYWTQFYVIDHGETLGSNITMYRNVYFNQNIDQITVRNRKIGQLQTRKVYSYKLKRELRKSLHRAIKHKSVFYKVDEGDLPPMTRIPIYVNFSKESQKYYQEAAERARVSHANLKEIENAFMMMRQISSGFIGFEDDNTGQKIKIEFKENPKLDALIDLIQSIPPEEKVLVFHNFIYSGDRISQRLGELDIGHKQLYGQTKNPGKVLDRFENHKDCQVLVSNAQSGGMGLNLQFCRYAVFYESPIGPILREQAEHRIYGRGETHSTFLYDVIMKGSVDETILRYIQEGRNMNDEILSGKKKSSVLKELGIT